MLRIPQTRVESVDVFPLISNVIQLTSRSLFLGDGFDWSEHHKNRVARSTSMSQRPASLATTPAPPPSSAAAARAMSTAVPEQPAKEMPKKVKHLDEHSERILKGDFVMS